MAICYSALTTGTPARHHRVESFLTGQTLQTVFSLINLLVLGFVLVLYNTTIFGLFIIGSLCYTGWVVLFLRQRRQLDMRYFEVAAKNQSSLVQILNGMQEIKLHNAEQTRRWEWERLQARLLTLQIRGLSLSQFQQAGAVVLNEGKNILITFVAARAVLEGQMTLGAMLAVQYIIGQLNAPVEQLIAFLKSAQDAQLSLERLNEIHHLTDEEPEGQLFVNALPRQRGIGLNKLSFTYPGAGNEPVLRDINLLIPAGKVTAIVGMSGSGKTTLLKLLLRFYEPQQGDIRIGETRLQAMSHRFWRSHCGAVMQDGYIFSDTIARNIAVNEDHPDPDRLWHAIETANISDLIEKLPLGLNTKIGAEGNGISQGQKQRILIARAVYKDPQYLFFDEATNALDAKNERVVLENLQAFFRGHTGFRRTVVVVAHRLSTVRNADQIVVLDRGVITEIGTHDELTVQRGEYYELVQLAHEILNYLQRPDSRVNVPDPGLTFGDLQTEVVSLLKQYDDYQRIQTDTYAQRQVELLQHQIDDYRQLVVVNQAQAAINSQEFANVEQKYLADKRLYDEKVYGRLEFLKEENSYLQKKKENETYRRTAIENAITLSEREKQLQTLQHDGWEKKKVLENGIRLSVSTIENTLKTWQQNYVLTAPATGRLSFLKNLTENEFVRAGDTLFTVAPQHEQLVGLVSFPVQGMGKLQLGQRVIIRLDNFPYQEFGTVPAIVAQLLPSTNWQQYRAIVTLPKGLTTLRKNSSVIQPEMTGSAELVTDDVRLLERAFYGIRRLLN